MQQDLNFLKLCLLTILSVIYIAEAFRGLSKYSYGERGSFRGLSKNSHVDYTSSFISVPLTLREGLIRSRGLLRNGNLPIMGAVKEVGYFYTRLALGTPARHFTVIIDTGSTITYVPCTDCKHCGKHQDPAFDPEDSKTSVILTCNNPKCSCGSPACQCTQDKCFYARSYAEKSSSEGWLIEDNFAFPDNRTAVKLVFGCELGETGEIFRQMADGILGMGNNYNAFQSQLVAQNVIEDVFSLCFGFPSGGIMLLGDVPLPSNLSMSFTPLDHTRNLHYYNVKMEGITVDGKQLVLPQKLFDVGYGTVLDSGTTFTYLPTAAFKAFADRVSELAEANGLKRVPGADPQYPDICWKGASEDFEKISNVFPSANFVFQGGATLPLAPYRYLFKMRPGSYCLGIFDNGNAGTLIGGVSVRNVLVQYNRKHAHIGFAEAICENFWHHYPHPQSHNASTSHLLGHNGTDTDA